MRLLSERSCKNYPLSIQSFKTHFTIYYFHYFYDLKAAAIMITLLNTRKSQNGYLRVELEMAEHTI